MRRSWNISALGFLCAVQPAQAATIVRADTGATVEGAHGIDAPLLVRLEGGETVTLLGRHIVSTGSTRLYLVVSSKFARWAVVSGDAAIDGVHLRPGDAALGTLSGGGLRRLRFDAVRLAAEAPPGIAGEIGPALVPVIATQRRSRFLGTVARAAAPSRGAVALEQARRSYLAEPAIVSLRADAADPALLGEAVARAFVLALDAGNRTTIAALLDPTPFLAGGANWQDTRAAFADRLVAGAGGAPVGQAEALADGRFRTTIAGQPMLIRLVRHDGMPFVAALEPVA